MFLPQNEWAPITDADLFEEEEVAEEECQIVQTQPVEPPPVAETPVDVCPGFPGIVGFLPPVTKRNWPDKPQPIYTVADWRIFFYWIGRENHSIDTAAYAAGINVYDALVTLEKRSPWFYALKVMVHPQNVSHTSTRRQKGFHTGMGGSAKNYARFETRAQRTYNKKAHKRNSVRGNRLSEDEARLRFLTMLGDNHPDSRPDSKPELIGPHRRGVFHANNVNPKLVKFWAKRCEWCHKFGHKIKSCPALTNDHATMRKINREKEQALREAEARAARIKAETVPAGSEIPTAQPTEGYETETVKNESK